MGILIVNREKLLHTDRHPMLTGWFGVKLLGYEFRKAPQFRFKQLLFLLMQSTGGNVSIVSQLPSKTHSYPSQNSLCREMWAGHPEVLTCAPSSPFYATIDVIGWCIILPWDIVSVRKPFVVWRLQVTSGLWEKRQQTGQFHFVNRTFIPLVSKLYAWKAGIGLIYSLSRHVTLLRLRDLVEDVHQTPNECCEPQWDTLIMTCE